VKDAASDAVDELRDRIVGQFEEHDHSLEALARAQQGLDERLAALEGREGGRGSG